MADQEATRTLGEAGFRREAAHALSTPLGSLLLQAELIDHYLHQDKVPQAREAVAALLREFDSFGRRFRSVFSAMADIAEEGPDHGSPRECLAEALVDIGEEAVAIGYRGASPRVSMPAAALTALMRRLALLATEAHASDVTFTGTQAGAECLLSLTGVGGDPVGDEKQPFESERALHLWTAREIVARHGGRLVAAHATEAIVLIVLPIA
ncbi:hypothetical protein QFZ41_000128 [Luteibacter sp. W1I16]|uniref:hypothetical protein n=1 Tax=Luteibacter sp. W1I16 TaxID=3373922 RepID=UPI003D1E2FDF